jgi:putative transposase
MKRSRHSEEKIVSILREAQGGIKVRDVCARHNISEQTYYGWKRSRAERDSQPQAAPQG